jgi:hypothetical protein
MKKFKSFTAKEIIKYLQKENIKTILEQLAFYKKAHKTKALLIKIMFYGLVV